MNYNDFYIDLKNKYSEKHDNEKIMIENNNYLGIKEVLDKHLEITDVELKDNFNNEEKMNIFLNHPSILKEMNFKFQIEYIHDLSLNNIDKFNDNFKHIHKTLQEEITMLNNIKLLNICDKKLQQELIFKDENLLSLSSKEVQKEFLSLNMPKYLNKVDFEYFKEFNETNYREVKQHFKILDTERKDYIEKYEFNKENNIKEVEEVKQNIPNSLDTSLNKLKQKREETKTNKTSHEDFYRSMGSLHEIVEFNEQNFNEVVKTIEKNHFKNVIDISKNNDKNFNFNNER